MQIIHKLRKMFYYGGTEREVVHALVPDIHEENRVLLGLFSDVLSLAERTGIADATKSALRAVGLGYIFGITADICDSLGEKTISTAVTAVGRVQIFLVSYPYFEKIIAIGLSLVE